MPLFCWNVWNMMNIGLKWFMTFEFISSLSLPTFFKMLHLKLCKSHYLLQASYKLFYAKRKVGRGHSKTTWTRFWQFLTTYLPTSTCTFFTLNVDKKKHFLTTYPPHLVHVVFEGPPRRFEVDKCTNLENTNFNLNYFSYII